MKTRTVFGTIFLVTGLGIFFVLGANSISAELHDVLHEAPFGGKLRQEKAPAIVNEVVDGALMKNWPAVSELPHIKALNGGVSTNDDPFQQFNVVRWLGWAFIWAALMEIGVAYLSHTKTRVEE